MEEFGEHFKSWLSGFIDGEGCFNACPNGPKFFCIQFIIALRFDDVSIIKKIHRYLGGQYRYLPPRNKYSPQVSFEITSAKNCLRLIEHLEKYPLQSRKQKDYEIWKEAVIMVARKDHLNGRYNYILNLCKKLKKVRQYREQLEIDLLPPEIEDKQLYFETKERR